MDAVETTSTKSNYGKEGCNDLPVEEGVIEIEGKNYKTCISYWHPNAAELECLVNGGLVKLTIVGGQPPVIVGACEVKNGPEIDRELKRIK